MNKTRSSKIALITVVVSLVAGVGGLGTVVAWGNNGYAGAAQLNH
jgi:hypothetical protein